MNDDQTNGTLGGIIAFSLGALVGAGIALILAPQSGAEIRKIVRDYVAKAADELMARSQGARATVKTALDHGREAMKGVGKEMKTRV